MAALCSLPIDSSPRHVRHKKIKSVRRMQGKRLDITGLSFGRWFVISFSHMDKYSHSMWNCKCDCGTLAVKGGSMLVYGDSISCGCYKRESTRKRQLLRPYECLYNTFVGSAAKRPFTEPVMPYEDFLSFTTESFCHYCGGTVTFKRHSINIGSRGSAYNLDRKDNNIGYTKENCLVCCRDCNYMKHKMGYEEFISKVKQIAAMQERNGTL